jgi:hypothetical protein
MGYTTDFQGQLSFDRVLTNEEVNYIKKFNDSRRMKRDVSKLYDIYKGEGGNPFLPKEQTYGNEGEYFVGGSGDFIQERNDSSIIDYNESPGGVLKNNDEDFGTYWSRHTKQIEDGLCQPGLWCQWTIEQQFEGGEFVLVWDGGEKFYNYVEWLNYLINHFFEKWGVKLNGEITWEGEESEDMGKIVVVDNVVTVKIARITYE